MEGCTGKLDRYNDHKICDLQSVKETVEIVITLEVCVDLKTDHMENRLKHSEVHVFINIGR
jgi:biotin synthase-related radical SAM superfamily protein